MNDTTPMAQDAPSASGDQPLLTHEKSLTAKVGQGSEARDILDQQIIWLGSQCVTQLYSLIRTAKIHDRANAAMNQPVNAILTIIRTLSQDKPVVLHCKTGARSAEALAVLKGAGFSDAVHVGGGVIAWANQIDPSLPTY